LSEIMRVIGLLGYPKGYKHEPEALRT